jgi:uncharacterized protein YndB with AHSA1/START domain
VTPTGLTKDAGWQIGVSRTVAHPVDEVWDRLVSAEGLACWLGPGAALPPAVGDRYDTTDGATGELRSHHPQDRLRLTHRPAGRTSDTIVQVAVRTAPGGTSIRFHQERLADAEERERQRAHWRSVLDELIGLLDS